MSIPRTRAFDWATHDGTRLRATPATHPWRAFGAGLSARARGALPQSCALCAARSGAALVCAACARTLPRTRSACPVCALPATDAAVCGTCLSRPPPFAATVAALVYAFPVDRLLQQLKYGGRLAFADWAADELAAAALAALRSRGAHERPDCVAPLPLAPARQRERGFNQAREIAARVASAVELPLLPLLERVTQGVPQAALPWARRKANVHGAFACMRSAEAGGRSIALVDDVMTTGATLAEAALTLKRAGAARVECWVVARTPPPEPAR